MILSLKNISKSFKANPLTILNKKRNNKKVLHNISLEVNQGDCIALLGKNGSGKTTLLKIISGLLSQDSGSIDFNHSIRNRISIVNTNDRSFFIRLTVYENLLFFSAFNQSFKKEDFNKKLSEVLDFLGLSKKRNALYLTLSSGEKKKIAFARAILRDAKILLFDEITSNLDIIAKNEILIFIQNLIKTGKVHAAIFSTHSIDEVLTLSNRLIMLDEGYLKNNIYLDNKYTLNDIKNLF